MLKYAEEETSVRPWAPLHLADEDVIDVMRKARELQLERAEAMCVEHCRRRVSVHNAVAWFLQAHVHGLQEAEQVAKAGPRTSRLRA